MIEYNKNSNFPQNLAKNDARRLVPDLFLFFRKALYEAKAIGLQLSFNIFRESPTWHTIQTNCTKFETIDSETNDPEICSILIF